MGGCGGLVGSGRWAAMASHIRKLGHEVVVPPGDVTAEQMEAIAELSDRYSFGELRASHEQNVILADVKLSDLHTVWQQARALGFATPNIGLLTNVICCPGGARSNMIDCDSGPSIAPSAPCSRRNRTICSRLCAQPHSIEAAVKPAMLAR